MRRSIHEPKRRYGSEITRARRLSRLLALCTLALGMLAVTPSVASAYEQWYCGILKGNGNWCGASGQHSWDYNQASNTTGPPTWWVCERIWRPSNETEVERTCGSIWARSPVISRSCVCLAAHVAQYTGGNDYVYGYGTA